MTIVTRSLRFRAPMLAANFEQHEDKIEYPCYVQPKVDGVRCITDGQSFWSRNGKRFPIANLAHLVVPRFPFLVDAELALSGTADFEDIVSIVKRAGHPSVEQICINVFDCMTADPYDQRKVALRQLFERYQVRYFHAGWKRLTTKLTHNRAELERWHKEFLLRGYEGSMVRQASGLYVSARTPDLLKWKPLKSAEFPIVAVIEAKGKDRGTPIFVCDANGAEFRVRPMGTMVQRQQMWRNRRRLIGQPLTVEYQNLTKYGVPRFPRAKVLRNYE